MSNKIESDADDTQRYVLGSMGALNAKVTQNLFQLADFVENGYQI